MEELHPDFEGVGKCVQVFLTTRVNENDTLILDFEYNSLTLTAERDCCSVSWFEEMENFPFGKLCDKEVIDWNCNIEDIEMPHSKIDEYDLNHVNEFIIRNEDGSISTFPFLLRNSSNGYYDGYISSKWLYNAHTNVPIPQQAQLYVVVGLPCSGKSTYIKNTYDLDEYVLFDDFLNDPKNSREIMKRLVKGEKVVVSDPRLCDPKIFEKEIVNTFTQGLGIFRIKPIKEGDKNKLNNKYQLTVVQFTKNPFQSVMNAIKREKNRKKAMDHIRSIVNLEHAFSSFGLRRHYTYYKFIEIETYA